MNLPRLQRMQARLDTSLEDYWILHFEEYTTQRSPAFACGVNQIIASFKPTR